MNNALKADDLWPLVAKLSVEEQLRLARMVLREAKQVSLEPLNLHVPPLVEAEDASEDDALSWEGYGWDSVDAPH